MAKALGAVELVVMSRTVVVASQSTSSHQQNCCSEQSPQHRRPILVVILSFIFSGGLGCAELRLHERIIVIHLLANLLVVAHVAHFQKLLHVKFILVLEQK